MFGVPVQWFKSPFPFSNKELLRSQWEVVEQCVQHIIEHTLHYGFPLFHECYPATHPDTITCVQFPQKKDVNSLSFCWGLCMAGSQGKEVVMNIMCMSEAGTRKTNGRA